MKKICIFLGLFLLLKHNSQSQDWEWAKRAGGPSQFSWQNDVSYSCAVDKKGNSYITGYIYNPNVDFDNIVVNGNGWPTFFLAKYDIQGNVQWVKTTTNALGRGVAVDSKDNIYVTGKFWGIVEFAKNLPMQSLGSSDVFVAKYNPQGECIWSLKGGTTSSLDSGLGIAVDSKDLIYVTGIVGSGSGNFEHTPIRVQIPNNAGEDLSVAFVSQVDPSGFFEWTRTTVVEGGYPYSAGYSVDTDTLGNVYIAGIFSGACSYSQNIKLTSTLNDEDVDGFIAKYSSTGQTIWAKKIGSPATPGSSQVAQALVVDQKNNIYVTGHYLSGITIGNITFPPKPSQAADAYLAKFNANGSVLWAKNIGNPVDQGNWNTYGWSLALSDSGAVYLAGEFVHEVKFDDNNTLLHPDFNTPKIFLVRYNPDSAVAWSSFIEKQGETYPWGLATFVEDTKENLFLTGEFHGFMAFNNFFLLTKGEGDIFLAKAALKKN